MDYYVPEPVNHDFRNALVSFILVAALSIGVGIFAGYGVRLFLGNDEEVMLTYVYTERMAAAKTAFSADNYAYQLVSAQLSQRPGVRLLSGADGTPWVVDQTGPLYTPADYFTTISPVATESGQSVIVTADGDEEIYSAVSGENDVTLTAQDVVDAVETIFAGADAALAEYEDSAGDPVTDVRLFNAAAGADGRVYFYLYYDYAGFVSIAYDPLDTFSQRPEPIRLLANWYLDYAYHAQR